MNKLKINMILAFILAGGKIIELTHTEKKQIQGRIKGLDNND